MNNNPIGVFDSGIGGLSTLKELREQLPHEDYIYVADLAWSPYGNKSIEVLQQRAELISRFLLRQQVKAIVVACNTATAAAVASLREKHSLPIIGVEPGIKPAIQRSLSGVIGILATERTIASEKFRLLLQPFDRDRIHCQPCNGLADAVELGEAGLEQRRRLLQQFIPPLLDRGVDTLVLGCTHYPLIAEEIRQLIPASVELIDTSAAIARQVVRKLEDGRILNQRGEAGRVSIYSSARPVQLDRTLSWYLQQDVTALPLTEENSLLSS